MNKIRFIVVLGIVSMLFACKTEVKEKVEERPYAIVIHGGAGTILKEHMTSEQKVAYEKALSEAIEKGYSVLDDEGSALEAVQKAVTILEDSPLFNAGKGAVFDNEGKNRLDASIMDGRTLNSGAVAGVTNIKNPINAARLVMDSTRHVLLSGKGAEIFAEHHGVKFESDEYFYTQRRYESLMRVQEKERKKLLHLSAKIDTKESIASLIDNHKYGTVGAVALDQEGNIAAATSTGGLTNKKYGRIGDSPIIGAGTYANNNSCGVSSTGTGEYFIRTLAAHEVSNLMQYKNMTADEAANEVVHEQIAKLGGDGGLIVLDKEGNIAWDFNTEGMYRGYKKSTGEFKVAFYEKQKDTID